MKWNGNQYRSYKYAEKRRVGYQFWRKHGELKLLFTFRRDPRFGVRQVIMKLFPNRTFVFELLKKLKINEERIDVCFCLKATGQSTGIYR